MASRLKRGVGAAWWRLCRARVQVYRRGSRRSSASLIALILPPLGTSVPSLSHTHSHKHTHVHSSSLTHTNTHRLTPSLTSPSLTVCFSCSLSLFLLFSLSFSVFLSHEDCGGRRSTERQMWLVQALSTFACLIVKPPFFGCMIVWWWDM